MVNETPEQRGAWVEEDECETWVQDQIKVLSAMCFKWVLDLQRATWTVD